MMSKELEQLGLTVRCVNALASVGVKTFAELLDVKVSELRSIPNLGAKGIEYILALVDSKGYKLHGQDLYEKLKSRKKAQRTWVGLTDDEVIDIAGSFDYRYDVARAAEAKLKEKNT